MVFDVFFCPSGISSSNQKRSGTKKAQSAHKHHVSGEVVHHGPQHNRGVMDLGNWQGMETPGPTSPALEKMLNSIKLFYSNDCIVRCVTWFSFCLSVFPSEFLHGGVSCSTADFHCVVAKTTSQRD